MKQRLYSIMSVLGLIVAAYGQTNSERPNQTTPRPTINTPSKRTPSKPNPAQSAQLQRPNAPQQKYLAASLNLGLMNLGAHFAGHDITAVFEAIKSSPALKEKSEFESTSAFQSRRAGFPDHPLFASVMPTGLFAFVVEGSPPPEFKYDADSQTLAMMLTANTKRFILNKDNPALDSILIRYVTKSRDSYIGTNAFGANLKVDRTYAEEYDVALDQVNWLFHSPELDNHKFTYLLAMGPEEAKALKADLNVLLVCRLTEPWFRMSVYSHDPTIGKPYELLVGENYLQIVPEQLWIFNSRTGEVVRKLSESSIAADQNQQLSLKLRRAPLVLEVTSASAGRGLYRVRIDEGDEERGVMERATMTFAAKRKLVLTLDLPSNLDFRMTLNGKEYTPNWTKETTRIGSYELIRSATVTVTVP